MATEKEKKKGKEKTERGNKETFRFDDGSRSKKS